MVGLNVMSMMLNWERVFDPLSVKESGRRAILPIKSPGSMSLNIVHLYMYIASLNFYLFFFGFWSWLADKLFILSLVMKLDFISQPSSNSTLPFYRITAHATVLGYFSTILAFMLLI